MPTLDEACYRILSELVRAGTPPPFLEVLIDANAAGQWPGPERLAERTRELATATEQKGEKLSRWLQIERKWVPKDGSGPIKYVVRC